MNGTTDNTPDISKYIVEITSTSGTYTFSEVYNTTGATITPERDGNNLKFTANDTIFITGKTLVLEGPKLTAGVQLLLASVTSTVVTLTYAQANTDKFMLQIQVVNI